MKRQVEKEISDTAAYQLTEADNQDVVSALRKHQEALRPKRKLASDVHDDWQTNTTPRFMGKVVGPVSSQHMGQKSE